jgi:hypothetical protein
MLALAVLLSEPWVVLPLLAVLVWVAVAWLRDRD